ncbi:GntR family transcriptional regulator [Paraburkholderia kirstenboschensis]|uniref:GntR family transcriptional regulator n=1 Tax=Paraburkholderia kirstenboschensis TaxID=1245436 RepID=A0ABZ0EUT7_9BURK|nr:GntR family transcriptional regulator [Paraburkholderia kirstenboschensis]WOD20898.1 GntR family transcriptional regulator [Paraburkholderia kirstenboschensis]
MSRSTYMHTHTPMHTVTQSPHSEHSAHCADLAPADDSPASQPLYRQLAGHYRRAIRNGVLRPGERMPSMRAFMQRHGVSLATATERSKTTRIESSSTARSRCAR